MIILYMINKLPLLMTIIINIHFKLLSKKKKYIMYLLILMYKYME